MNPRARTALIAALAFLLILPVCWTFRRNKSEVQYNAKSLSHWFFSQRRDFLYEAREKKADEAFKASGTNGFAFLISMLNKRGNSSLYFKLYRAMPRPIQSRLQYPISGDDIRMMALGYLAKTPNFPNAIPEELLARLARRVPDLSNPRVRLGGLHTLDQLTRYEVEPLLSLCRHLLDDPHFGIRLDAALMLADLGIKEPRSIPVLLAALEDKEKLHSTWSISTYAFGQPPGGSGNGAAGGFQTLVEFAEMERKRVLHALELLDLQLNEHQKSLVRRSKIVNDGQSRGD